jgi:ABC-2 type transport system permease protein
MKLYRIFAIVMRHLYLYKRSLSRLMEIFYWPLLDLLVWGFITLYLDQFKAQLPNFLAFFLGAMILWDILYRSQQGISVSFLEEVWSRNLLNLFVTPLKPGEFLVATMAISIFKLFTAAIVTVALAWLLYSFNIFIMGLALLPFILNLMVFGWAIGVSTTAVILRYGQKAEIMAWGLAFLFQPVSAVFYPVSVLPTWLQHIAWWIPATPVFEGMRAVITSGVFPVRQLLWSLFLNLLYITTAVLYFYYTFHVAKQKGLLLRVGE